MVSTWHKWRKVSTLPDVSEDLPNKYFAAMGNFGNNSPVPGMMGGNMGQMGDATANTQMENKRGPGGMGMQQQNIPTGPGHHNVRGGFRGRGRGGLAIRGRGGNGGSDRVASS